MFSPLPPPCAQICGLVQAVGFVLALLALNGSGILRALTSAAKRCGCAGGADGRSKSAEASSAGGRSSSCCCFALCAEARRRRRLGAAREEAKRFEQLRHAQALRVAEKSNPRALRGHAHYDFTEFESLWRELLLGVARDHAGGAAQQRAQQAAHASTSQRTDGAGIGVARRPRVKEPYVRAVRVLDTDIREGADVLSLFSDRAVGTLRPLTPAPQPRRTPTPALAAASAASNPPSVVDNAALARVPGMSQYVPLSAASLSRRGSGASASAASQLQQQQQQRETSVRRAGSPTAAASAPYPEASASQRMVLPGGDGSSGLLRHSRPQSRGFAPSGERGGSAV